LKRSSWKDTEISFEILYKKERESISNQSSEIKGDVFLTIKIQNNFIISREVE
jgi:hypothetical protein